jgi:hypothetical protein
MINYLSDINPANKEAITTIKIRLNVSSLSPYLPRCTLLTLTSLQKLQYLKLEINTDYDLLTRTHHDRNDIKYTTSLPVLDRIRNNRYLRSIEGLKGFGLVFIVHYYRTRWPNNDFELLNRDAEGVRSVYGEVEEELRAAMVKGWKEGDDWECDRRFGAGDEEERYEEGSAMKGDVGRKLMK